MKSSQRFIRSTLLLAAGLALCGTSAYADTVNASADVRTLAVDPNGNHSGEGSLALYNNGGNTQYTWLNFDLSAYAGKTVISSAKLTLKAETFGGGYTYLTGVNIGTANAAWTLAGIIWNNQPGITLISGAVNPGGTFATGDDVTWTIPAADVQGWIDSGFNGLALTSAEGSSLHFSGSRNGGTPTLTFTVATIPQNDGIWTSASSGNWNDAANWQDGLQAHGLGRSATFHGTTGVTVTLDADRLVGSLSFDNADYVIAGSQILTFATGAGLPAVSVGAGRTVTLSAVLDGAQGLTKTGSGTLLLSGTNAYSGVTVVDTGILRAGSGNAFGANGAAVTVNPGAAIDVNNQMMGYNVTVNGTGLDATHGAIYSTVNNAISGFASLALGSDASIGNDTYRFDIGRAGGRVSHGNNHVLTKIGNNTMAFQAPGENFASVIINGGALQPEHDSAFGNAPITVNAAGSLAPWGWRNMGNALTLAGGSVQTLHGYDHVYTGPVTAQAGSSSILNANSGNIYLNGNLTGTGTLVKQGANSVFLGGDNSGFSGVYINEAVNTFVNSSTAGSAAAAWVVDNGNLASRITAPSTIHLGALAGAGGQLGNEQNFDYALNFSVGGNDASTLYNGVIRNNMDNVGSGTVSLTKVGTGTLTLTRPQAYSGDTVISNGTLKLSLAVVTEGAARHFDASALSLTDGAAITRWSDLSGNGAHATVPGGNANPTYLADAGTGTGLGAVSFLKNNIATDSQALGFSRDTNVRSVFSVFKGSSFLLTDSGTYRLHRPGDDNPADALLVDYGQLNYLGKVYVNGAEVINPTANPMPTSLHNGYNLVEIVGNGNTMELDSFNKDRIYHAGNQSHAETILFDSVVSEEKRLQIEAYLNNKWFGIGDGPAVTNLLNVGTSVVLGGSGRLDLGHTVQTVTGLSGSGVVTNGTLTATGLVQPGGAGTIGTLTVPGGTVLTGTLQVDATAGGACDMLTVQGAVSLSGAALNVTALEATKLDSRYAYTVLTCSGTPSSFASVSVPSGWNVRYKNGSVQLVSSGTLILMF